MIMQESTLHVVCIGASAGGLETLQGLFDNMPTDLGCAYIIVQHLSPDFKSLMGELIGKHTKMTVKSAEDGEHLAANIIYLMPPGKIMRVVERRIYLSDVAPDTRVSLPINELFRSVAEDTKRYCVGIILSGTGSDGSRGVQAMKDAGSMVIAQNPDEATFDGMPKSAIDTGAVDLVLNVADIPERLKQFFSHPLNDAGKSAFLDLLSSSQGVLQNILNHIQEYGDLDISAYKESVIARRLEHRLSTNGLTNLDDYLQFLKENPEEVLLIKQDLLIGVTQFFRDPEVWQELSQKVLTTLLTSREEDQTIRVWCAGCSTGEEPYTVAILFLEKMAELGIERNVKIFASDIDHSAISFAANGVYPDSISSEIPIHILNRYFIKLSNGSFQVIKQLRSLVVFATHNIIQDPPFSNMDIVSCRNTMIYLSAKTQQRTLAFFHFALRMGGHLVLGSAETPGQYSHYYLTVDSKCRIYSKRKDFRVPISTLASRDLRAPQSFKPRSVPAYISRSTESASRSSTQNNQPIAYDGIVEEFIPPSLVVNERHDIVYVYKDISLFTQKMGSGHVSTSLSKLLQDEVSGLIISLCHEVMRTKKKVLLQECIERDNQIWSIQCALCTDSTTEEDLLIISFLAPSGPIPAGGGGVIYGPDQTDSRRITELDNSLLDFQTRYQEAMAELANTREELQSSNEELMAANEELQSTNEELQSVNEELYTVNSEYQEKITELTEINNDLENLIQSTNFAVLILGRSLEIRRFTSAIHQFVNILDVDIGRDVRDLRFKGEFEGLLKNIEEANNKATETTREFSLGGKKVSVQIVPYRDGGQTRGVVVTFVEA